MNVHVFGINFAPCDMDNVTIVTHDILEKKHCVLLCTTSSVSERGDMDSENYNEVIRSILGRTL